MKRTIKEGGYYSIALREAGLTYHFESGRWSIDDITSYEKGQGKRVVSEFVRRVGHDQPVCTSPVVEPFTMAGLESFGLLSKAEQERKMIEVNPAIYQNLKLVRVLEGGGIEVERFVIEPWGEEFMNNPPYEIDGHRVNVYIFGRTR